MHKTIELSPEFKSQTTKAILSIVLFVVVYLILITLAIALTIACVYLGVMIVITVPRFLTLALGVGLASLGFMVLFFLIKFLFKSHKIDRSHLVEIKQSDEPQLFEIINDIVKEVDTKFPKRVYLSSDVNASVFYDSSFWSMFFPIRKNLQIGIGLTNCVSKEELRAILAHEFGHFSQKSMKVGSYVYNVNQVIFNMLYDNEGFDRMIESWGNTSGYFVMFASLAIKIIQGIQWILQKMYSIVNLSYMALSREMEFHADEIAANVTGSQPLQTSLMRLNLANFSLSSVLSYYGNKVSDNLKSPNIYPEQSHVMAYLAKEDDIKIQNDLPQISLEHLNKYNRSKLVVKNQWASHPSTEERVNRLEKLNIEKENNQEESSNAYFKDIEQLQKTFTTKMFEGVQYTGDVSTNTLHAFVEGYKVERKKLSFPKEYDGYYDKKNPSRFELDVAPASDEQVQFDDLFSNEKKEAVYIQAALESDIEAIRQISSGNYDIKTFDYDGIKYKQKAAKMLVKKLEGEMLELNREIEGHDEKIYRFFLMKESVQGKSFQLRNLYEIFFVNEKEYETQMAFYNEFAASLEFINHVNQFEVIDRNLAHIRTLEYKLKNKLRDILKVDEVISSESEQNFKLYLSKDWNYFNGERYLDDSLSVLYDALNSYQALLNEKYFKLKKDILEYQVGLLN